MGMTAKEHFLLCTSHQERKASLETFPLDFIFWIRNESHVHPQIITDKGGGDCGHLLRPTFCRLLGLGIMSQEHN